MIKKTVISVCPQIHLPPGSALPGVEADPLPPQPRRLWFPASRSAGSWLRQGATLLRGWECRGKGAHKTALCFEWLLQHGCICSGPGCLWSGPLWASCCALTLALGSGTPLPPLCSLCWCQSLGCLTVSCLASSSSVTFVTNSLIDFPLLKKKNRVVSFLDPDCDQKAVGRKSSLFQYFPNNKCSERLFVDYVRNKSTYWRQTFGGHV